MVKEISLARLPARANASAMTRVRRILQAQFEQKGVLSDRQLSALLRLANTPSKSTITRGVSGAGLAAAAPVTLEKCPRCGAPRCSAWAAEGRLWVVGVPEMPLSRRLRTIQK